MPITLKTHSGVTLIESMIALLVISIGLLGIAGLQINSLKQNSSAYWHSQAVLMAHNMADRIRANRVEIANYVDIDTSEPFTPQACLAQTCSSAEMRAADTTDWKSMLSALPSGRGIIRSTVANQQDIIVMWDDEGTGASGTDCGTDPKVDLTCYIITM